MPAFTIDMVTGNDFGLYAAKWKTASLNVYNICITLSYISLIFQKKGGALMGRECTVSLRNITTDLIEKVVYCKNFKFTV